MVDPKKFEGSLWCFLGRKIFWRNLVYRCSFWWRSFYQKINFLSGDKQTFYTIFLNCGIAQKTNLLGSSDSLKMNCSSYKSLQSLAWIRPGVPEILHYKCRLCFEKKHTETLTYGYSKVRSWAGVFKNVIYFKIWTLWFFIKLDLIFFFKESEKSKKIRSLYSITFLISTSFVK